MTREDSKRDVDRISLNYGEPLNPVKMRVGQTQAWVRLPQRRPGLQLGARSPATVSAKAEGVAPV